MMSFQCENCQSLFLKTLEIRILPNSKTVFYKKRCKRCKFKYLLQKDWPAGPLQPVSYHCWQEARKVPYSATASSERGKVFVSEYTQAMSASLEQQLLYHQKIRALKGMQHERA